MHRHERTGRPLGESSFLENPEQVLDRSFGPQKPGPKMLGGWELDILSPEFAEFDSFRPMFA